MSQLKGRVMKSTGSWYHVLAEEGKTWRCRVRGKFRTQGLTTTNPVAVGDEVTIEPEDEEQAVIVELDERRNYIVRRSVNLSHRAHILASNIDQALLVVTAEGPVTYPGFIDRFTVAAEAFLIPVIIVFNKMDAYGEAALDYLAELMDAYELAGYQMLEVSALKGWGMDALKEQMKNKVTLFSGNSGVGKSTLVNAIEPGLQLRTAQLSKQHQTGQHTTTFAEMFPLSFGGYIIDTPGIKGFGVVDIKKEELALYFPEMKAMLPECHFYNCQHINEPKCAVKAAVESGEIAVSRYNSYLTMFHEDEEAGYR